MQKIIKRYICIIVILSTMMGYGQTICFLGKEYISSTFDGKTTFVSTGNDCTVAPAIGVAIQPLGLVDTSVRTQIQSLGMAELQAELARRLSIAQTQAEAQAAQAAQNELAQAEQARAQAQHTLDAAQQALFLAISNVTATTQINLSDTQAALAAAEQYAIQAQINAQNAAHYLGVSIPPSASASNSTLQIWFLDNDHDGWYGTTYKSSFNPGAGWSTNKGAGQDCNDSDPTRNYDCSFGQIVGWYLDNDGDGYFAAVQPSATRPTAPGTWTTAPTKGPDCNDTNPAIGMCSAMPPLLTYYVDNDGDGYDGGTISSTTNPGSSYKTFTKGLDCNDGLFSADNSVCTTMCSKIKAQNNNTEYKAKIVLLKGKTGLKNETGVIQKADGTFLDYIPVSGNPNHLVPPPGTNFKGGIHAHIDPYASGKFRTDGTPIMLVSIPMFSPTDIHQFLETLVNTKTNNIPTADVYSTFVSSSGTYTLKFTGNIADVHTNFNWDIELDNKFIEAKNENGLELGFLLFLKDNIGINGITLYKIKDDGTIENKSLDTNNLLQTTPCQ